MSDVKNSRLRQDLPISINDRVILPFCEVLFSQNFENKVLAKISEFTVLASKGDYRNKHWVPLRNRSYSKTEFASDGSDSFLEDQAIVILYGFLSTVKAAPRECLI